MVWRASACTSPEWLRPGVISTRFSAKMPGWARSARITAHRSSPAANAAAIDHGRLAGRAGQRGADFVAALHGTQMQLSGQAFQPDGVDLAILLGDQGTRLFDVAVAPTMADFNFLAQKTDDFIVGGVVQVNDCNSFHR